jgi:methyltransferase (TIGR00027 family)
MTTPHSKKKHSQTALLTALYRSIANKEFQNQKIGSDYLAEYFLPFYARLLIKSSKMRIKIRDKNQLRMPGVFEYVIARTALFDYAFINALNENVPQIVILGAGYDTRAYRFANINKSSRIIELDSASTQNRKVKCLKKRQTETPEQLIYISINFNKESLKDVLRDAGYEDNRKTLFLWEGVCMYLEPKAVDAVLGFIAHSSHKESVIAFDYVITVSNGDSNKYYGAEEIMNISKKNRAQEPFQFTIDEDNIESFLDRRGLKLVRHLDHKQIAEPFSTGKNEALMGAINELFRFSMASPNRPT